MDSTFLYAFLASVISSVGGLAGGVLLLANERLAQALSRHLVSFAAGVLLAVTFLDLLPEAVEGFDEPAGAFRFALLGVVVFFIIERIISSIHRHQHVFDQTDDYGGLANARPLVILGDTIHNLLDGIVVAVAFIASLPIGLATATSVLLHELPHEIADFTILIRSGMARRRVLAINILSALVAPLGTVMAYVFATNITGIQLPLLALAAGNLLYIATADLLPLLLHEKHPSRMLAHIILFLVGIGIVFLLS